jgi:hypothetical protein
MARFRDSWRSCPSYLILILDVRIMFCQCKRQPLCRGTRHAGFVSGTDLGRSRIFRPDNGVLSGYNLTNEVENLLVLAPPLR